MKDSLEGKCSTLAFWPHGKSFDEAVKELSTQDNVKRIFRMKTPISPRDVYIRTSEYDEVTGPDLVNLAINHIETGSTIVLLVDQYQQLRLESFILNTKLKLLITNTQI